jgi:hypothetical protein
LHWNICVDQPQNYAHDDQYQHNCDERHSTTPILVIRSNSFASE